MQTFDNIRLTDLVRIEIFILNRLLDWIEEQIHHFNTQFSTLGS